MFRPPPSALRCAILCASVLAARAVIPYGHAFNSPGDFSPSAYAFIAATYPVFTVEKRHASAVYGNASAPAASPHRTNSIAASVGTARRIKQLNASAKVLMYWNSALHWNFYECEEEVAPGWLLPPSHRLAVPSYNYAVPAFRAWWVRCAVDALRGSGGALDGLFIDAVPKLTWAGQPADALALWGAMLDALRAALPGALLLFNGDFFGANGAVVANATLLQHADAVYIESLASLGASGAGAPAPGASIAYLRYLAASAAAAPPAKRFFGHGLLNASSGGGGGGGDGAFTFGLAVFLLVARGDPAEDFFLANDGYQVDQGVLVPHPEYDLELGAPRGPFTVKGHVLTREFERATVVADLDARRGAITQL